VGWIQFKAALPASLRIKRLLQCQKHLPEGVMPFGHVWLPAAVVYQTSKHCLGFSLFEALRNPIPGHVLALGEHPSMLLWIN